MNKNLLLSVFLIISVLSGCEKTFQDENQMSDKQNKKSLLVDQIENNSSFSIDKVVVSDGDLSIYVHHIGEIALHDYKLFWEDKSFSGLESSSEVLFSLASLTSDKTGDDVFYQKLVADFIISDNILATDSAVYCNAAIDSSLFFQTDFQIEIMNLSDTAHNAIFMISEGSGSWQSDSYDELIEYTESELSFQLYSKDSTGTIDYPADSTYYYPADSTDYFPTDSGYNNPVDSTDYFPADTVDYFPVDSSYYNPVDSVDNYPSDSLI